MDPLKFWNNMIQTKKSSNYDMLMDGPMVFGNSLQPATSSLMEEIPHHVGCIKPYK